MKQYRCSRCGKAGHNRRGCGTTATPAAHTAPPAAFPRTAGTNPTKTGDKSNHHPSDSSQGNRWDNAMRIVETSTAGKNTENPTTKPVDVTENNDEQEQNVTHTENDEIRMSGKELVTWCLLQTGKNEIWVSDWRRFMETLPENVHTPSNIVAFAEELVKEGHMEQKTLELVTWQPECSTAETVALYRYGNGELWPMVARHEKTPENILMELAQKGDDDVLDGLTRNPATTENVLFCAMKRMVNTRSSTDAEDFLLRVANSTNISTHTMQRIMKDETYSRFTFVTEAIQKRLKLLNRAT